MVIVIDYGSGNLRSVAKALETVGAEVRISQQAEELKQASHLVLPGVGAFADCHRNLSESGLLPPLLEHIQAGKPFLGICVGMQLLFSEGHEYGVHPGLDLFAGSVVRFATDMRDPEDASRHLKVPHMGWNQVQQTQAHPLWKDIPDGSHFYFVHSYHGCPQDPQLIAGSAEYGIPFTAAIARDNLFATQFHPEKSQRYGLRLLHHFTQWRP
ncbi:imidazole glycerol phosphate synthase subunit HisH [Candidatus Magnetaquicoccus inordinatus]|uniref:imidazole glycerol phosphate synthase subunit HisH n=1 Tax=Candidatus Magnetaquicoccus inordinatus TaxID=2496818 RepID=UPI00102C6EE4|nr:imidazole glycerol phosphate synthase subunit HisH [Candidatus Magnetaquicoccus inordinatus]